MKIIIATLVIVDEIVSVNDVHYITRELIMARLRTFNSLSVLNSIADFRYANLTVGVKQFYLPNHLNHNILHWVLLLTWNLKKCLLILFYAVAIIMSPVFHDLGFSANPINFEEHNFPSPSQLHVI